MIKYQKILKSRNLRRKLLALFSFIPDKIMLRIQYYIKMGRRLDLKTPTRYTEKIQWYKLNYHNPLLPSLVDKYDVKDYIRKMNLEDCLVEDYGVYDNYDDIRWDVLPSSFVIKDTLGGGSLSVIIVKDKKSFSQEKIRSIIDRWVRSEHRKKTDGRDAYSSLYKSVRTFGEVR